MSARRVRRLMALVTVGAGVAAAVRALRGQPTPAFAPGQPPTARPTDRQSATAEQSPTPQAEHEAEPQPAPEAEPEAEPQPAPEAEPEAEPQPAPEAEPEDAEAKERAPKAKGKGKGKGKSKTKRPERDVSEDDPTTRPSTSAKEAPSATVVVRAGDLTIEQPGLFDAPTPQAPATTGAAPTAPAPMPEDTPRWVEPVEGECPESHPIKAKLSSGIYHLPDSASYGRTRPDRCYATEAEAVADGLRPPRR